MHDELVHQRIVHAAVEQSREAVFLAARPHEDRSRGVNRVAIRVAFDDCHLLTLEIRQCLRGHIAASPCDEHESILQIGLGEEQHAFALGVLPHGRAAVELAGEKRRRELPGVDDRRLRAETDSAERGLDQVDCKTRLSGRVRERCLGRRDQIQWSRLCRNNERDDGEEQQKYRRGRPAASTALLDEQRTHWFKSPDSRLPESGEFIRCD